MTKLAKNLLIWIIIAVLAVIWSFLVVKIGLLTIIFLLGLIVLLILFNQILKNPFWGLLGLTFFLPFERIASLNLGFMDVKVNQLFGGLTIIAWVLSLLFSKKKIQPFALTWPIAIFISILIVSLTQSGYLPRSLLVFIFILFTIAISILVNNFVTSKEKLNQLLKVLLITTLITCLFSFWQFMGDIVGLPMSITGLREAYTKAVFGFPRVQGFSMEPLYLGNFLLIPLGILSVLVLNHQNLIRRNYQVILLAIILITQVLTVARSAYLAVGIMILFLGFFYLKKIFSLRNILIFISVCIVTFSVSYTFLIKAEPRAIDEFISRIELSDFSVAESTVGRLDTYQKAIDYWRESPLIGIGIGNYAMHSKNYPNPEITTAWDIVNNEYLEILAETGILGLASFALIFVVLFWRGFIAYRYSKDDYLKSILIGLNAALLAILVQYNFFSTLYIIHFWFLIGLTIVVQNLCFKKND